MKKLKLKTARAYHLRLVFQEFWGQAKEAAEAFCGGGIRGQVRSRLSPMREAAATSWRTGTDSARSRAASPGTGLVSSRRAGGHHQAVEPVLPDHVPDVLLGVSEQELQARFGMADVGHPGRLSGDLFHVHHRSDVVAAVANEDAHARRFVRDVALPRILVALDHGAARERELAMAHTAAAEAWATDSGISLGS